MGHLKNRKFVIGVSGGIAAYKAAELVRLLRKADAEVRVIMTRGACEFITPLTLQALSGQPVHMELLDENAEAGMGHIELARWADAVVVAPATADLLSRIEAGRADDLLTSVVLATASPLLIAPAMNQQMWSNPATQRNIESLRQRGATLLGPASGEQACGEVGAGRLIEPSEIVGALTRLFDSGVLAGRQVVITAGPTRESIDPVRYLSNHSSGKMGFALARAAFEAGAAVTLIAGPVSLPTPEGVTRIDVVSAQDMLEATLAAVPTADVFIAAAAVADFRPHAVAAEKIKKKGADDTLSLQLIPNPDILKCVADLPRRPARVVGFAAETKNLLENARSKLEKKAVDLIVANDVSQADIGFNSEHNEVIIVSRAGVDTPPRASKQHLAGEIIRRIAAGI